MSEYKKPIEIDDTTIDALKQFLQTKSSLYLCSITNDNKERGLLISNVPYHVLIGPKHLQNHVFVEWKNEGLLESQIQSFEKIFEKSLALCKEIYESHNEERGASWMEKDKEFFIKRIRQEWMEYNELYTTQKEVTNIDFAREVGDVVNFCLMLMWYHLTKGVQ